MDKKKTLIENLRKFKKKITLGYFPEKVILFGSMVSGKTHKDSDVDLMIVSKRFEGVSSLKRSPNLYLEWQLDYPVDFLCYTPKEFDNLKNRITIVREAVKTGIEI